ncbi:MAG: FlgD immunoglobulin-like domain containing protein [Candidatus Krumholzibacteriia bacterium]|nr:T9SS type A sorting domain-containing protein [Candidatus Latescibacterota bacterium]
MKTPALLALAFLVLATHPALAVNHWHVSTYWAEYVPGHGQDNHALYCGDETIPACEYPDTLGGVSGGWIDEVEWRHTVDDPSLSTAVRITGLLNYDLPDEGWDFLDLYIQRGAVEELFETWTGGDYGTVYVDFGAVLYPGDYTGPYNDEVRLVWRVRTSTDGWDDEDCLNPSHGACQLDDLAVAFDGAQITFDDFEPGSPVHWTPVSDLTGVDDSAPATAQLAIAAHPNPFNPKTTLAFTLPTAGDVTLAVYDLQGQRVRTLLDRVATTAGHHEQIWDGRDDSGRAVTSGIYFYRLSAGEARRAGKLTLVK